MSTLMRFNKPYQVLCQFSSDGTSKRNLSEFIQHKRVYAAGRLDYDSEGLLLLTDDGKLQHRIAHPKFDKEKTYLVQVDGDICGNDISKLARGVMLKEGQTKPAKVKRIHEPSWLWPRNPPIRVRRNIPTTWIELTISEGKNRQVRRMTAMVGHPTLRLIRTQIGPWSLDSLQPGEFNYV